MECLNKRCNQNNKKGKCKKIQGFMCIMRIAKTPTYAEEQLEYAQDKENRYYDKECQNNKENKCSLVGPAAKVCFERVKEPINYEEEYNKLKKENDEIKNKNAILIQENHHYKQLSENRGAYNKKLEKENEQINMILETYKTGEIFKSLSKENDNYSAKITILEQDNKEYKIANEGLASESKERVATIKKMQRLIEDNTENVILRNKVEDLEKEVAEYKETRDYLNHANKCLENEIKALKKQNNQGYMEQMNITINEKNNYILRLEDKLNTIDDEYQVEIQELKKRINKYQDSILEKLTLIEELKEKLQLAKSEENETEWLKSILTKYEKEVKQLNKKEKGSAKYIRHLRKRIEEETEGKLERQKENIDLKNALKTLASLL